MIRSSGQVFETINKQLVFLKLILSKSIDQITAIEIYQLRKKEATENNNYRYLHLFILKTYLMNIVYMSRSTFIHYDVNKGWWQKNERGV